MARLGIDKILSPVGSKAKYILLTLWMSGMLGGCLTGQTHAQTPLQKTTLSARPESEPYANTQEIIDRIKQKDDTLLMIKRMNSLIIWPKLKAFIETYNRPIVYSEDREKQFSSDIDDLEFLLQGPLSYFLARYDIAFLPHHFSKGGYKLFYLSRNITFTDTIQSYIQKYNVSNVRVLQFSSSDNIIGCTLISNSSFPGERSNVIVFNHPLDELPKESIIDNEMGNIPVRKMLEKNGGLQQKRNFVMNYLMTDSHYVAETEYLTDLQTLEVYYDEYMPYILETLLDPLVAIFEIGYEDFQRDPSRISQFVYYIYNKMGRPQYILSKSHILEMIVDAIRDHGQANTSRDSITQYVRSLTEDWNVGEEFDYWMNILRDPAIKESIISQIKAELKENGLE